MTRVPDALRRVPTRGWVLGGVVAAVVAVAAALLWPGPEAQPPRARQYVDVNLCLLTGENGVADPAAAPAWAAMQEVSTATRVRVQYLAVTGQQNVANARTFLASLAQSRCGVVVAAGALPVEAVREAAATFPAIQFLTVGGTPAPNVSTVDSGSASEVQKAVTDALAGRVTPHGP